MTCVGNFYFINIMFPFLQGGNKLPAANLLLLKWLLSLLHHISQNCSTSRMSSSNLAVRIGPNILSLAEDNLLEVLVEVTDNVCCIYLLATAFQAHQSFAVQRCLAASSLEQMLVV